MSRQMLQLVVTALALSALGACQSQLTLMPTPEVLKDSRFDLFAANPEPMVDNQIRTFFVTTREQADEQSSEVFLGKLDTALHMGTADLQIGSEKLSISNLATLVSDESKKPAWSMLDALVLGTLPDEAREGSLDGDEPPEELAGFFGQLNAALEKSAIDALTIYVHGASNTFYWSVAQGAQYQFFTGNNAVVLTFAWPSPGSIWGYGQDKRRSDDAVGDFVYLIEMLARYSVAEQFNIIAYSAGGRVVGGALGELGRRYEDPEALRLGQIYLTASDQPVRQLADDLPGFFGLLDGLTITAKQGDSVLGMAKLTDRQVRVGAPTPENPVDADLTESERAELTRIINARQTGVIDLNINDIQGFKFSHGAWYENPWVSTDVMVTLLGGFPPSERGLDHYESDTGRQIWYFPEDYLEVLKKALLENVEDDPQ